MKPNYELLSSKTAHAIGATARDVYYRAWYKKRLGECLFLILPITGIFLWSWAKASGKQTLPLLSGDTASTPCVTVLDSGSYVSKTLMLALNQFDAPAFHIQILKLKRQRIELHTRTLFVGIWRRASVFMQFFKIFMGMYYPISGRNLAGALLFARSAPEISDILGWCTSLNLDNVDNLIFSDEADLRVRALLLYVSNYYPKIKLIYFQHGLTSPEQREWENSFGRFFLIANEEEKINVLSRAPGVKAAYVTGMTTEAINLGLKSGDYAQEAILVLLQPYAEFFGSKQNYHQIFDAIFRNISSLGKSVVVRPHPAMRKTDAVIRNARRYSLEIDTSETLAEVIPNVSIVFGVASTGLKEASAYGRATVVLCDDSIGIDALVVFPHATKYLPLSASVDDWRVAADSALIYGAKCVNDRQSALAIQDRRAALSSALRDLLN